VKPEPEDNVIRFESTDDGAEVLAYVHATPEGQIAIAFAHELDGDLELLLAQEPARELAAALLRAIKEVTA
jgi:hypothetical protein